jgi:hypothetical protein
MTDDERMKMVIDRTAAQLSLACVANGDRAAMIDAGAIIAAARNYLIMRHGRRATYTLFAGLADEIIKPELPVGP